MPRLLFRTSELSKHLPRGRTGFQSLIAASGAAQPIWRPLPRLRAFDPFERGAAGPLGCLPTRRVCETRGTLGHFAPAGTMPLAADVRDRRPRVPGRAMEDLG